MLIIGKQYIESEVLFDGRPRLIEVDDIEFSLPFLPLCS